MNSRDRAVFVEAANLVDSPAAHKAREAFREAIYKNIVEADELREREDFAFLAKGAEFYWKILEKYARDGKSMADAIRDEYDQQALEAID